MKRKHTAAVLAVMILVLPVFACGSSERLENELAYRQIGIKNMDDGNYEDALIAFSTALEQHIGQITDVELDICYYKAAAQYELNDVDGALATYNALLEYDKKEGKAYFLRGSLYLEKGDTESALSDYESAVKYCKKEYELYIQIYEKLSAYNMAAEGEEYLNQAFTLKGNEAVNLENRGRIYYLLGQYDNAKTELLAAIEKESVKANLYLAEVYDALGDDASAENYYQAYLGSGEADSIVMNALAAIQIEKGNYDLALEYINQGLSMEKVPNRRMLLYNQIIACEFTGDFAGAWTAIQEYCENYPTDEAIEREYLFLKNRQGIRELSDAAEDTQTGDSQTEDTQPEDTQTEDSEDGTGN